MHPSRSCRVAAAFAGRCRWPRSGLGTAFRAVRILVAFAVPPLVFAHEGHPAAAPAALSAEDNAFLQENDAAMTRMMNDMSVKPSGDVDRDFTAMMIPHHQGAIDMATIELRYGKNEQLRRIAQEIIVDQMQEIAAMKLAIGEPVTDTAPVPTQPTSVPAADVHHRHPAVRMDMPAAMKK